MSGSADLDQVIEAELALLRPDVRANAKAVLRLLHADFREFGASGRVWDRDAIVAALAAEPSQGAVADDMHATRLADNVVLLTYSAQTAAHTSSRSSLWVRDDGTWRLLFHQGTPVPATVSTGAPRRIRRGTADDASFLADMMFLRPSREAVALAGDATRAARFQLALLRRVLRPADSAVLVLERDGAPIGFAEVTSGGDLPPFGVIARSAVKAFGVVGSLRAAWKSFARTRVDIKAPTESLHLVELQVHPSDRNQGAGGELLRAVEREARHLGRSRISLTTAIDNPARRLYERHGFAVTAEKRSARYERITGSPGRVLMVKALAVRER